VTESALGGRREESQHHAALAFRHPNEIFQKRTRGRAPRSSDMFVLRC
jgi:hypothetical protein